MLKGRLFFASAAVLLTVFIGCADYERPPKPDAPASGVILIAASDFSTGFLSAFDPVNFKVYRDIVPLHSDAMLRYDATNQATFVVQRLGADSLRRLDNNNGYLTAFEKSLGARSNPQSAELLPGNRIAVSFYNSNLVQILDRNTGNTVSSVDFSPYADADGYAEIAGLRYAAPYLFATVQRLNRLATDAIWPPTDIGYLMRIDISNGQFTAYALTHANPSGRIQFHAGRNSLIFAAPGRYAANYQLDGACLEFSLTTFTFLTPPITEAQAGYEIAECSLQTDGSGVMSGSDATISSVLASFDATAHSLTRVAAYLTSGNGGYFPGYLLHSNGKIYLSDRNIYNPGLRIFSGPTLTEVGGKTYYTGLPPFGLEEVP